jgi:hypothetical protein
LYGFLIEFIYHTFRGVETEADKPVSTCFALLIILAVILLEKPVAGNTLELTLRNEIFMLFIALYVTNFHRLINLAFLIMRPPLVV